MKVALIHGQGHRGTSYHAGRALANKLGGADEIIEFFLPRDMPHFCIGCYRCMDEGEEYCPHYEAMRPITTALDEADVLVFTTPVYCMRTTGGMKALLDHLFVQWISHRPKAEMYGKQAVVMAVGAGAGMRKAALDIKTSLAYWGITNIYTYGLRSMASSWEGTAPKTKAKIEHDVAGLVAKVEVNRGNKRVGVQRKFMFMVMRAMQKKGLGASPKDKAYWEEQGWLLKKRPWKP